MSTSSLVILIVFVLSLLCAVVTAYTIKRVNPNFNVEWSK